MGNVLQDIVLDVVSSYHTPMTFNVLFHFVNKEMKVTRNELKSCIKDLNQKNKLEIVDDLYKYKNTQQAFDETKMYLTDFCYMSVSHRWDHFCKQILTYA